jgi:hypothetical protein
LRTSGKTAEADQVASQVAEIDALNSRWQDLYDRITAAETAGLSAESQLGLYQELADTLASLGRPEEARAWHRLVLRIRPKDERSAAALERLRTVVAPR